MKFSFFALIVASVILLLIVALCSGCGGDEVLEPEPASFIAITPPIGDTKGLRCIYTNGSYPTFLLEFNNPPMDVEVAVSYGESDAQEHFTVVVSDKFVTIQGPFLYYGAIKLEVTWHSGSKTFSFILLPVGDWCPGDPPPPWARGDWEAD